MKRKIKVLNIVLIIVAVCTVAFTVTCLWLFYLYQTIPDTLVTMFYTTVVGELLCSSIIRVFKTKYRESEGDYDSRTDERISESISNSFGIDNNGDN